MNREFSKREIHVAILLYLTYLKHIPVEEDDIIGQFLQGLPITGVQNAYFQSLMGGGVDIAKVKNLVGSLIKNEYFRIMS